MFVCKLMKVFKLSDTEYFWKQFSCSNFPLQFSEQVFLFTRVLAYFNRVFSWPKGSFLWAGTQNCTCLRIRTMSFFFSWKAWVYPDIFDFSEGSEKPRCTLDNTCQKHFLLLLTATEVTKRQIKASFCFWLTSCQAPEALCLTRVYLGSLRVWLPGAGSASQRDELEVAVCRKDMVKKNTPGINRLLKMWCRASQCSF